MSSQRPDSHQDATLRELLASPLDDLPRHRNLGPGTIAGIVALVGAAIALPLLLLGGDEDAVPPGAADGPTTTTATFPGTPGYPSERILASMVAAGDGKIVLVGGAARGGRVLVGAPLAETWTFVTGDATWYLADPAGHPEGRIGQAAAYDAQSDVVVMFGGGLGPARWCSIVRRCISQETADTWWFFPATGAWDRSPVNEGPSARFGAAAAYDPGSDRVVLFGGAKAAPGSAVELYDDTWTYDFETDTWAAVPAEPAPPGRAHAAMAYDPVSGRILLWGGSGPEEDVDAAVWSLDVESAAWTRHDPESPGPERSWDTTLVYADAIGRLVLIGGEGPYTRQITEDVAATEIGLSDRVWVLDPAGGWSRRAPLATPIAGHAAAYDPATERVVMFALGLTFTYDPVSDTWEDVTPQDRIPGG